MMAHASPCGSGGPCPNTQEHPRDAFRRANPGSERLETKSPTTAAAQGRLLSQRSRARAHDPATTKSHAIFGWPSHCGHCDVPGGSFSSTGSGGDTRNSATTPTLIQDRPAVPAKMPVQAVPPETPEVRTPETPAATPASTNAHADAPNPRNCRIRRWPRFVSAFSEPAEWPDYLPDSMKVPQVRSSSPPRACSGDAAEAVPRAKKRPAEPAACTARAACACSLEGRRPKKPGVTSCKLFA